MQRTCKRAVVYFVWVSSMTAGMVFSCSDRRASDHSLAYESEKQGWPDQFGFGRLASAREIDSLNIDARPDGEGLPEGSGTVSQGRILFASKCERCHGKNGIDGPFGSLVANPVNDTSKQKSDRDEKTIGSYWPYATTIYDYVHRAMPYDQSGSLAPDEVYSITAFLLYKNQIIDSTFSITQKTLPTIVMPAKNKFIPDDRADGPEVR